MENTKTVRYPTLGGAVARAYHVGYTSGTTYAWRTDCTGCHVQSKQSRRKESMKAAETHADGCRAMASD